MPSQPPGAVPPPGPHHGPPKWAWWVVGILVPVLGLSVTLITQTGNNAARSEPPSSAPRASAAAETPVAADPTDSPPADDTVTTASPPPSPSKASPKVLRTGNFSMHEGDYADLEHGTVGKSVKSSDFAVTGGVDDFSPMSGRVAEPAGGATPKTCTDALTDYPHDGASMDYGLEGTWFCLPTSANHLAAVEWMGDFENEGARFHFIVWDVPAPPAADR
ncbi:hypothetical protein ABZY90_34785 [Streptomyces sp. NPDC006422]|uniref:hypothetical protein n=2 Tax=Streptomyces TaxID=1883 RepID=UPI0033BAA683